MSINSMPVKLLLNELATDTVVVSGGILTIKGLPGIDLANIVSCTKQCPEACTEQVTTVVPTVPGTPCECPYIWEMKIKRKICVMGRTDFDLDRWNTYQFDSPTGSTPTVSDIIDHLVDQINGNPYSIVTATKTGTPGSYTDMVLTEKDCDSDDGTCGFEVFVSSGTQTTGTAHVSAILKADDILREFGIQPGSFGERPNAALCGTYCVYTIEVDPLGTVKDQARDHAYMYRKGYFKIVVNSDLANYATDFEDELTATGLPCFA